MSTYQANNIADRNRGSRGWSDVTFEKGIFWQIFIRHTSILVVPLCFHTRWKEVSVCSEIQMQWHSKGCDVKIPNDWPLSGSNLSSVYFQIVRQIPSTFISLKWCCYIVFRDWKSTKQTKMRWHLVYRSISVFPVEFDIRLTDKNEILHESHACANVKTIRRENVPIFSCFCKLLIHEAKGLMINGLHLVFIFLII